MLRERSICRPRELVKVTAMVELNGNCRSMPMALWMMYGARRVDATSRIVCGRDSATSVEMSGTVRDRSRDCESRTAAG